MEKQIYPVFKKSLNKFNRNWGHFLFFIFGAIVLSLFFATFFNKIWANDTYSNIGSMLSGVFGSSGALAGALAAILIALEALKISRAQYNFEVDRYIYDFINKEINPSIKKLQDLLISFSLLIAFLRASFELGKFTNNSNFNKNNFFDEYYDQLLKKVNDFQDKLNEVVNDKFALELLDEITNCRKNINPKFDSTSSFIFDILEKQELIKMNLKVFPYFPRCNMADIGFLFVNPYIADMHICLFENFEKINLNMVKDKTLVKIKKNVVTDLTDYEIEQKVNIYLIPVNFKVELEIREILEKLKDKEVRKNIWPGWSFND